MGAADMGAAADPKLLSGAADMGAAADPQNTKLGSKVQVYVQHTQKGKGQLASTHEIRHERARGKFTQCV